MKIFFSKKQYQHLVRSMAMAKWVIEIGTDYGAYDEEDDYFPDLQEQLKLADYVLSFAKEMGAEDYIEYDSELKQFSATDDFMTELADIMHEYDNVIFYDKLIDKLTLRDCIKKYGEEYFKMSYEERLDKQMEFEEKYDKEVYENGVMNLEIKE